MLTGLKSNKNYMNNASREWASRALHSSALGIIRPSSHAIASRKDGAMSAISSLVMHWDAMLHQRDASDSNRTQVVQDRLIVRIYDAILLRKRREKHRNMKANSTLESCTCISRRRCWYQIGTRHITKGPRHDQVTNDQPLQNRDSPIHTT